MTSPLSIKEKLAILADAAKYDASCASSGSKRKSKGKLGNTEGMGICHSYTPDGRCISLLKILLTNFCTYDCTYCVNRISSDVKRAKFSVDEVVWLTIEFYKRNYIEGLFLSSGIFGTSDETMEEMISVAKKLRQQENFGGYIHLKAVAGCSPQLLKQAGWWCDRLSANIELPSQKDLTSLAPAKSHSKIEDSMTAVNESILESEEDQKKGTKKPLSKAAPKFAAGGQSTQMIVGATESSDKQIIGKANALYHTHKLRRVYYTAFSPIPSSDPRLPLLSPPLVREHRLYQADWLLRFYGYKADELATDEKGNFSLAHDPKVAWALANVGFFPVDVNQASKWQLLRVPGFGARSVEKILKARKIRSLKLDDLKKMKVSLLRSKYFIQTSDLNPFLKTLDSQSLESQLSPVVDPGQEPTPKQGKDVTKWLQPSLFESGLSALNGEV